MRRIEESAFIYRVSSRHLAALIGSASGRSSVMTYGNDLLVRLMDSEIVLKFRAVAQVANDLEDSKKSRKPQFLLGC